jgi:ubiquinone/menaquinone biosynthesis C-methylase UbiE
MYLRMVSVAGEERYRSEQDDAEIDVGRTALSYVLWPQQEPDANRRGKRFRSASTLDQVNLPAACHRQSKTGNRASGPHQQTAVYQANASRRLDLHHEIILRLRSGRLIDAPISADPHRILDIGTGTGIWAIDMADKYPSAEVIGTDITPIQPRWVPPNCHFELDDAEMDWTYKPGTFDLIHARNVAPSIGNWPQLMAEMYKCTKPGGYVELSEFGAQLFSDDGSIKEENPLNVSVQLTNKAMATLGRPFPVIGTLKKRLEDAGFVDVVEKFYKQPFGPWPKDPV